MRGKGLRLCAVLRAGRITPACAGKRLVQAQHFRLMQDHPRMCGEKGLVSPMIRERLGSPPHVRGKVVLRQVAGAPTGITPACAGKSLSTASIMACCRDHPRVCGEKAYSKVIAGSLWGSPPRMRGKGRNFSSCVCPDRITPAYAGKSCIFGYCACVCGDHPRMCGEKLDAL